MSGAVLKAAFGLLFGIWTASLVGLIAARADVEGWDNCFCGVKDVAERGVSHSGIVGP